MLNFSKKTILFFLFLFICSCIIYEEEIDNFFSLNSPPNDEMDFILKIMKDKYLWYDKVPDLNSKDYVSNDDFLEDLKYKELDRWSFLISKEQYQSYYENNQYEGFGFYFKWHDNIKYDLRVGFVIPGSPAGDASLDRSDRILKINNQDIKYIVDNELWETVSDDIYNKNNLSMQIFSSITDSTRDISITKRVIDIKSVVFKDIFEIGNKKVGYIVYNEFNTDTSLNKYSAELEESFKYFSSQSIDELVFDLRYNGGGRLDVCQYLASLISNETMNNKLFLKIDYNNKYQQYNSQLNFEFNKYSININRIFFITSGNTASASECLINGLKPYIDVKIIGTTTHGKPVGMNGFEYGNIVFFPITINLKNAENYGGYYSGLPPDQYGDDDLTKNFGSVDDPCLKEAIYFISNGTFSQDNRNFFDNSYSEKNGQVVPFKGISNLVGCY